MNEDFVYGFGVDESTVRAERKKARELRKTRWWQLKTADGICSYCQRKFPVNELTMDHIIPLSRGGRSTKGNLVPCCKECNTAKKTDLPPELEELF
ncbi:MAG: HNH endonuclease [Candidatus Electrothrix sp. AUS1_2]|nr:HNH endonuclease [Candidatus Electrothrix sp. AUS1_2]